MDVCSSSSSSSSGQTPLTRAEESSLLTLRSTKSTVTTASLDHIPLPAPAVSSSSSSDSAIAVPAQIDVNLPFLPPSFLAHARAMNEVGVELGDNATRAANGGDQGSAKGQELAQGQSQGLEQGQGLKNDNKKEIQLSSQQSKTLVCCYHNCNVAHKPAVKPGDRQQFYLHPYVSKNFQRENLYMCSPCITNWRKFREKAEKDGELVLPNEVNEELCAVCSDTPQNLIMCASCPRSFCGGCLDRLLTEDQRTALQESDEWMCMCCTLEIEHVQPPLRPNLWQSVQIVDSVVGGGSSSSNQLSSVGGVSCENLRAMTGMSPAGTADHDAQDHLDRRLPLSTKTAWLKSKIQTLLTKDVTKSLYSPTTTA